MNEFFNSFIIGIFNCFDSFFELFKKIYTLIIGNNWLTLLICISFLWLIIDYFDDLQSILTKIFNMEFISAMDDKDIRSTHSIVFRPHYRKLGYKDDYKVELFDYNWLEDDGEE